MGKWQEKIKRWLMKKTELPADALLDVPRVTLIGQIHIYIENHQGVLHFSNTELRLSLKEGQQLKVFGENLVIKTIMPEEILVEGKIQRVEYTDIPLHN